MPKKPKTPKPLPSVLTVASPISTKTDSPRLRLGKSPSRAAKTSSPSNPPVKPKSTSRSKAAASPSTAAPVRDKIPSAKESRGTSAPGTVEVTFALVQPEARQVLLGGTFNNWSAEATPLERLDDGRWQTRLRLAPGRHEYKFLVDGQWQPDPSAQEQAFNNYGTINSVVEVRD
jgi:hypothetical protein